MALYQKLDIIRSTIYVESFIIVSRRAQNAQFFALCRCTKLPFYLYTLYFAYTRVVHVAMDAVVSLARHSIPSWQGRVSGKITRFNLHL